MKTNIAKTIMPTTNNMSKAKGESWNITGCGCVYFCCGCKLLGAL